jgi:hypothetical protein
MTSKHITEEYIQDYLDKVLDPAEVAAVQEHLQACADCREQVRQYQSLYSQISHAVAWEPSKQFSRHVVRQLGGEPLGSLHTRLLQVFGGACGVIGFYKLSSLFMSYAPVFNSFKSLTWPKWQMPSSEMTWWTQVQTLLTETHVPLTMVSGVFGILVFMVILDQILRHIRIKLALGSK